MSVALEDEFAVPALAAQAEAELEYLLSPTRLFTCSPADRAVIASRSVAGRALTNAQLANALNVSIRQATTEARAVARALRRPNPATVTLFRSVFGVRPGDVPAWRTANSRWRNYGELAALRLERAASDLDSGHTRYFCLGCRPTVRACTTPHAPIAADRHRLWIGREWWRWWRASQQGTPANRRRIRGFMASTLLHEALHIHFVLSHKTVPVGRPSLANPYCYDTLVARFHRRDPKQGDANRCRTGWRPK